MRRDAVPEETAIVRRDRLANYKRFSELSLIGQGVLLMRELRPILLNALALISLFPASRVLRAEDTTLDRMQGTWCVVEKRLSHGFAPMIRMQTTADICGQDMVIREPKDNRPGLRQQERFHFVLPKANANAINLVSRSVPPWAVRRLMPGELKDGDPGRKGIVRFSDEDNTLEIYFAEYNVPRPKTIPAQQDENDECTYFRLTKDGSIAGQEKSPLDGRWWVMHTSVFGSVDSLAVVGTCAEIHGQQFEIVEPYLQEASWSVDHQFYFSTFKAPPDSMDQFSEWFGILGKPINLLPFPSPQELGNPMVNVRLRDKTVDFKGTYVLSDDEKTLYIYYPNEATDERPLAIPHWRRFRTGNFLQLMKGAKQFVEPNVLDGVWQVAEMTVAGKPIPHLPNLPNEAVILGQCMEFRTPVSDFDDPYYVSPQYYAALFDDHPGIINLVRYPLGYGQSNPMTDVHRLETTMGLKGIYRLSADGQTAEVYHAQRPLENRPKQIPEHRNDRSGTYFRLIKTDDIGPDYPDVFPELEPNQ